MEPPSLATELRKLIGSPKYASADNRSKAGRLD